MSSTLCALPARAARSRSARVRRSLSILAVTSVTGWTRRTPRVISCAEESPEYLAIPRGCQSDLAALLDEHGVTLQVEDKRTEGADLEAAVSVMRSDFGSIQMLHPERGPSGELHLIGHRGFSQEAAAFWEWVRPVSGSPCGAAMRSRNANSGVAIILTSGLCGARSLFGLQPSVPTR